MQLTTQSRGIIPQGNWFMKKKNTKKAAVKTVKTAKKSKLTLVNLKLNKQELKALKLKASKETKGNQSELIRLKVFGPKYAKLHQSHR